MWLLSTATPKALVGVNEALVHVLPLQVGPADRVGSNRSSSRCGGSVLVFHRFGSTENYMFPERSLPWLRTVTMVAGLKFETTTLNISEAEFAKFFNAGVNLTLSNPGSATRSPSMRHRMC